MRIIIENTNRMVQVESKAGGAVPGRIWEGKTDTGIYVQCVITRIATPSEGDQDQFERELESCKPPKRLGIFPARMVI